MIAPAFSHQPVSQLIDTDAFCAMVNKSKNTAERWRREGTGPAYIKVGRSVFYDREDVQAWLQSHKIMSTSANA